MDDDAPTLIRLLAAPAAPASRPAAILGLLLLTAVVLWIASRAVRRMEISYGAETRSRTDTIKCPDTTPPVHVSSPSLVSASRCVYLRSSPPIIDQPHEGIVHQRGRIGAHTP